MCGRSAQFAFEAILKEHSVVYPPGMDLSANYNVAPTQQVFAIVQYEDIKHLDRFSWGLVPFWAKDISIGSKMINARMETVLTHRTAPCFCRLVGKVETKGWFGE